MQNELILPSCYLPPISWFSALVQHTGTVKIEKFEHFPKQTYRNRAHIYSPNGLLSMSIPVIKGSKNHTKLKDVKISYDANWQKIHWKSLESGYRSSSFFEYYEDDIRPFYEKKTEFLLDYNEGLLNFLFKSLKLDKNYEFTSSYELYDEPIKDYREVISPKKLPLYSTEAYYQVFSTANGFIADLSIVDVLFNHGNRAMDIIRKSQLTGQ
ncbi:WbqC family protein [Solitalea canadensis]|uniref:WbqC-like protein n=1 Tax=Solitalea canadensis (strain ATCC 29591 / DSM 3403 / JCM 21819 / LMG 8368 / NBRC 15130 / NCIMB 12057 / USAM 9D) TaxID=929556 RepID=H8KW00_SOLCM|nr:WbqC family protein [Solitalea canadensis]AFD06903.1 WbqC-like protein [Solitalea canadensis DSM 3403]